MDFVFLTSIPHVPFLFGYGTTQIGDYYEKSAYTETYTVIMSREPENITTRKAYTLPAEIERRKDYLYTTEDYDEVYDLAYHINYLYFPNGGYLSFSYDEAYENPEYCLLEPNKERRVTDYHGDEYYITLTTEKHTN